MSHASRSTRTAGRTPGSRRAGARTALVRPRPGRHRRAQEPRSASRAGAARDLPQDDPRAAQDDLVEVREHRGADRAPWWQRIPHPSPPALAGIAVLVLIAAASIHLTGRGGAVAPEEQQAPASSASAAATAATASSANGAGAPGTGSGAPGTGPGGDAAASGAASASSTGDAAASGAAGTGAEGAAPAAADGTGGTGDAGGTVVVYVSGAVEEPGVVELPAGSRVADALEKAGGQSDTADLTSVNLARVLVDAEQIHVPAEGEEPRPDETSGSSGTGSGGSGGSAADSADGGSADGGAGSGGDGSGAGPIDINTADAEQLDELPGVGPAIAQRIIDHRTQNGPFASVDDLAEVSGIGPATLEKIRPQATV